MNNLRGRASATFSGNHRNMISSVIGARMTVTKNRNCGVGPNMALKNSSIGSEGARPIIGHRNRINVMNAYTHRFSTTNSAIKLPAFCLKDRAGDTNFLRSHDSILLIVCLFWVHHKIRNNLWNSNHHGLLRRVIDQLSGIIECLPVQDSLHHPVHTLLAVEITRSLRETVERIQTLVSLWR